VTVHIRRRSVSFIITFISTEVEMAKNKSFDDFS